MGDVKSKVRLLVASCRVLLCSFACDQVLDGIDDVETQGRMGGVAMVVVCVAAAAGVHLLAPAQQAAASTILHAAG